MIARTENVRPRLFAVLVLLSLALHAAYKAEHGLLGEMLWACHVASLSIAIGLLVRSTSVIAVGTLFHVAVGVPAYALDVLVLRDTSFTSVLVHLVPPLVGLVSLRGESAWPRWTPLASGALYVALIPPCRWFTDPALNVNLAFSPWPPLAPLSPSPWVTWLVNVAGMAVALPIVDALIRRWSSLPSTERGPAWLTRS
jgi:hypothetical protein